MKTCCLILIAIMCLNVNARAVSLKSNLMNSDSSFNRSSFLLRNNIEKGLGRKLSWKEKIGFFFYKKTITKTNTPNEKLIKHANNQAKWAFAFAILGYIEPILFIPAFILSHKVLKLEKENPGILSTENFGFAKSVKKFFIVWLLLILLFSIFLLVLIASLPPRL